MDFKICEMCCSPIFRDEQFAKMTMVVDSDNQGNVFWAERYFHAYPMVVAGRCREPREPGAQAA